MTLLDQLNQAIPGRDVDALWLINATPTLYRFHGEPRYQGLFKRMGTTRSRAMSIRLRVASQPPHTGDHHMSATAIRDPQLEATVAGHKATVRRMLERLSAGDVAGFTDNLLPNYVRHSQAMPPGLQEIRGKDMMHEWLQSNFIPFPDYHEELEWLVCEGDFVAWRSRGTGTQSGPLGPFPATNKRMDVVIIGMHRFEGSLVAETWTSWDNVAVLAQLGHMGAP